MKKPVHIAFGTASLESVGVLLPNEAQKDGVLQRERGLRIRDDTLYQPMGNKITTHALALRKHATVTRDEATSV